jgi:acyl-CoA thioesterase I
MVDTFNAYPHLLHKGLKERFPFAILNTIVTAIGGENSESGSNRFESRVLCHQPDVLTIDYGLNDRGIGLKKAGECWSDMIEKALARNIKVILLTPTWEVSCINDAGSGDWVKLQEHAEQIRRLADKYEVGLLDNFRAFEEYMEKHGNITDLLSWYNHPNRRGHEIVAHGLLRWFAVL